MSSTVVFAVPWRARQARVAVDDAHPVRRVGRAGRRIGPAATTVPTSTTRSAARDRSTSGTVGQILSQRQRPHGRPARRGGVRRPRTAGARTSTSPPSRSPSYRRPPYRREPGAGANPVGASPPRSADRVGTTTPARSSDRTSRATCSGSSRSQRPERRCRTGPSGPGSRRHRPRSTPAASPRSSR